MCIVTLEQQTLLFSYSGNEATIIDLDFTEKEGVNYPSTYLSQGIDERHTDAKAYYNIIIPRRKEHDIRSLKFVMEQQMDEILIDCNTLQGIIDFCNTV